MYAEEERKNKDLCAASHTDGGSKPYSTRIHTNKGAHTSLRVAPEAAEHSEPQRTQFEVEMPVPLLIYACICQIREKTGPKRLFSSLLFSYQSGNMERKCIDCAVSHLPQESVSCWYALCMSYCGGVVGGSDTARGWHPPVAGSVSVGLSFALHMPRPGLTRSLVPLLLYAVLCGVLPAFPSRCGRSDPCVLVQHTKHTLQCIRRAYSNIFRY